MMAPYTVAHLKLGLTLAESGVPNLGKRLGVYLTNTLEEGLDRPQSLFQQPGLAGAVTIEAIEAGEIKNERPIMVVIGNPPYSGISSNETDFANSLIKPYKVEPGGIQPLQEKKHWLNDDYVKFFAFAESAINRNGSGIVALVTNHGYLDNPTFRGMRWRLRQSFDQIYVLDLHGNSKKKERAPDGSPDKNVFDIQQGVAIFIGVKLSKSKKLAQVWSGDLLGSRAQKFDALRSGNLKLAPISPDEPMHYFKSLDLSGKKEYESGISLDELFREKVAGIVTARDYLAISFDPGPLIATARTMSDPDLSDAEVRQTLFPGKTDGKYLAGDSRGWKLTEARKQVAQEDWTSKLRDIDYRPFDTRQIYYSQSMVDWPRFELMSHFDHSNLGLIFNRTIEQDREFSDIFVTKNLIQHHSLSIKEVNYVAPLYLYDEAGRVPNLNSDLLERLSANLGRDPKPEQVLDYAYGVLSSRRYRSKFREFLRRDFPRIPVPESFEQFEYFAGYGEKLRDLHLMVPNEEGQTTTYPISGPSVIERPTYKEGSVYINKEQHFGNVSEKVWDFWIGGYQPARKWLTDRKGRKLSSKDITHYQTILATLEQTATTMDALDAGHEYW
jgi:predicted helicase